MSLNGAEIVQNIEQYGSPEAPTSEAGGDATPDQAPESQAQQEQRPLKYTALGKEIEEPEEMVLKRASMGYDYAQKIAEFKKQQEEWTPQIERAKALEEKWKPFDEYAQKNPEWYQHWSQAWENRGNLQQAGESTSQSLPPEVQEKLSQFEQFMSEQQEREANARAAREDEELATEIKSIQEQYPDIDFRATDPATGKSLEQQIIDHGIKHNLPNFRSSFRDFYHDPLITRAQERAKEEAIKARQEQAKKGIIGTSSTPQARNGAPKDVSKRSWTEVEALALESLGLKN